MAAAHDPAAPAADRLNGADSQWVLTIRMLFGLGIRWAQPNSSRAGSAPSAGVHSRTRPPPRPAWRRHWHGVGYVVGAAVAADRQKRGYGAAITSALTRTLLAEFGVCALGIMDHNTRARAVFERVGYRERLARSLIRM